MVNESRDRPEAAAAGLQASGPGEDLWGFSPLALDRTPIKKTLRAPGQEQSACPGCLTASVGRGASPTSAAVEPNKRVSRAAVADRARAACRTGAGAARLDLSQGHFRTQKDREEMEARGQARLEGF